MKKINIGRCSIVNIGFAIWAILAILCFFMFGHYDLLVTAEQACTYLLPSFEKFYSINAQITGSYSANYFPSTYIIFALWNIPLKIIGLTPKYWGDWNITFILWNKLLVVLVFTLCAIVFYKIVQKMGFVQSKAKIALFLFISMPTCFFTVFISGQYDALTLLFILLGYYYWLFDDADEEIKFIFFFGVAATFKLFALLVFGVLLLLKEKRIEMIIIKILSVCAPMCIVSLPYLLCDKEVFLKQVFGFEVLDYVKIGTISFGGGELEIFPFLVCMILAYSYFNVSTDRKQLIEKSLFYICGIFAAMFGFFNWYPQWMLLAIPFLVISTLINKHCKTFFWIDMLLGIFYVLMILNLYRNYLDENMLRNGILNHIYYAKEYSDYSMADLFKYKNTDLLYTFISVIFCVHFLFKRHRFCLKDWNRENCNKSYIIVLRFLIPILLFVSGAFSFIPNLIQRDERIWIQDEEISQQLDATHLVQEVSIPCSSLSRIEVYTTKEGNVNSLELTLIRQDGSEVATSCIDSDYIANGGYSTFTFNGELVKQDEIYKVIFKVKGKGVIKCGISNESKYHVKFYDVVNQNYEADTLEYCGTEIAHAFISMKILGKR